MFLRDAWYVAALDGELREGLLPIKMLDEHIVLYRKSNGEPAALEDACVHRKLPLSMGRIPGVDGAPDTFVFASETCAFDLLHAKYERDVEPGELVMVSEDGVTSRRFARPLSSDNAVISKGSNS